MDRETDTDGKGRREQAHRGKMRKRRVPLPEPGTACGSRKLEVARKDLPTSGFRGSRALPTPAQHTSSLRNREITSCCCQSPSQRRQQWRILPKLGLINIPDRQPFNLGPGRGGGGGLAGGGFWSTRDSVMVQGAPYYRTGSLPDTCTYPSPTLLRPLLRPPAHARQLDRLTRGGRVAFP